MTSSKVEHGVVQGRGPWVGIGGISRCYPPVPVETVGLELGLDGVAVLRPCLIGTVDWAWLVTRTSEKLVAKVASGTIAETVSIVRRSTV